MVDGRVTGCAHVGRMFTVPVLGVVLESLGG